MRSVYGMWDLERLSSQRDGIENPTIVLNLYLLYREPSAGKQRGVDIPPR